MNLLRKWKIKLECSFYKNGSWVDIPAERISEDGFSYRVEDAVYSLELKEQSAGYDFRMTMEAPYETQMKLSLRMDGEAEAYHLIPCNIYGDNHIDTVKPGEYPALTQKYPGTRFCSPYWELRADRAAMPISFMTRDAFAVGIAIDPYADQGMHNGVFASLPAAAGVTLGYTNLPSTFVDKGHSEPSTWERSKKAAASGTIYLSEAGGKKALHTMIRAEYEKRHTRAVYQKSLQEAARAIVEAFVTLNWNEEYEAYTDMSCRPTEESTLKAWRPVYEIGWTGIAELAYPLVVAKDKLGLDDDCFENAKTGEQLIDQIITAWNPKSGLLNDLVAPIDETGSLVNGWWIYYGIAKDCHCSYNVGKAVFEILKTVMYLEKEGAPYPEQWKNTALQVLDTILSLQREDGNYGYTYSTEERKVLDWDGFAGCWFLPSMVYAYRLTGENQYLQSAKKAEAFYAAYVKELDCYATPMDTWKAMDEEGNLAFVKGTRLLHEATGDGRYLEDLEAGAYYEYLWRYGYATRPENKPVREGWNSCGGSVTSISNPHIHPMGVLIDEDLRYLAEQTKDSYHRMRAEDGTAWMMQNLECYPEKTEYGRYGIMSERWCPSDGLVTERYSDGSPYSSWFTFNLWATANVLEAIVDQL